LWLSASLGIMFIAYTSSLWRMTGLYYITRA
jgi:hypothetical protein